MRYTRPLTRLERKMQRLRVHWRAFVRALAVYPPFYVAVCLFCAAGMLLLHPEWVGAVTP